MEQHDHVLAFVDRCQGLLGRAAFEPHDTWLPDVSSVLASAPTTDVPAERLVIAAVTAFVSNVVEQQTWLPSGSRSNSVLAMRATREIIAAHVEAGFGMPDLARRLRVSRWHLARVLTKVTGHDIRWHITHARVQHAERLLTDPRLSIKEVAVAAGFRSTSELDRQFYRVHGLRPSAYRASRVGAA
jgi:AraC-like DNA-binding protein